MSKWVKRRNFHTESKLMLLLKIHPKMSREFPCAICNKECIGVTVAKDATLEEDSILCEKCHKWFHFICVGIAGNENFLKEGNDIDYICSQCDTQCLHHILPHNLKFQVQQ